MICWGSKALDDMRCKCGVFGIYNHVEAAAVTALGLHALQHRGQEAAGIVSVDGKYFHAYHGNGLVGDIFASGEGIVEKLRGDIAIGHNRYSTTGDKTAMANVQPFFAELSSGGIAMSHNGNLTNALDLRNQLVKKGCIFRSTMDTEVIMHLLSMSKEKDLLSRIIDALSSIKGGYSLAFAAPGCLIGVRDPFGIRPLALGRLEESYVIASESCAFDIIGARFVRDINAGELIVIDKSGVNSFTPFADRPKASRFCMFEYVYFARPDSLIEGLGVYQARKATGKQLSIEAPVDADVVVPVPDSGMMAAIGYAQATGLDFELGIIRNHYVGRTFIEPSEKIRYLGVKLKHNAQGLALRGKRVILVDDSIVRGTTSRKIVEIIREAGAKEIHLRIASPAIRHSCFYGIDTPRKKDLIAANMSIEEIRREVKADSLAFLSLEGLYRALGSELNGERSYCDACFSGDYPVELVDVKRGLEENMQPLLFGTTKS